MTPVWRDGGDGQGRLPGIRRHWRCLDYRHDDNRRVRSASWLGAAAILISANVSFPRAAAVLALMQMAIRRSVAKPPCATQAANRAALLGEKKRAASTWFWRIASTACGGNRAAFSMR